ncbi:MAG: hypothetical protein PHE55_20300 [Methylococcaceae bacterium]|nr:hypothetical protein [Methylococcaceae bacterium]
MGLLGILASAAVAGNPQPDSTAMPRAFEVSQLSIRLSRQAGNAVYQPWEVRLSGGGGEILSHDGKQWSLPYAAKDVVALLNALYEIRFFDLPAQYSTQDVAQLLDDGSVRMIQKFTSSSGGNSVCVNIASFEKCVHYGLQAPVELDRIFQRVFADAQRQVGQTSTK